MIKRRNPARTTDGFFILRFVDFCFFWNIFSVAKEHMFCYDNLTKEGDYRENNLSH